MLSVTGETLGYVLTAVKIAFE